MKSEINCFAGEWMRARMREGSGGVIKTQFFFIQETIPSVFRPKKPHKEEKAIKIRRMSADRRLRSSDAMFLELTWRLAGLN